MYTQFQRFAATLLLFSILLQSCGNPNWKMTDDASPRGASAQTYHPAKVKQRSASLVLVAATRLTERSMESKVEGTPVLGDEASSKGSTEALAEVSSKASYALAGKLSHALHDDRSNTPSLSPVHSSVVNAVSQHAASSSPSCSCSATSKRKQSIENMLQHVVLDKDAIARRQGTPLTTSRTVAPVVAARPSQPQELHPTSYLHAERLYPVFSRQPQPKVQHVLKATECKASHLKPSISLVLQPYPSAQGHQVRFQEANGKWLAQVQDVWGCAQLLPVVCAPDQNLAQAIQKLARRAPGQHKYWVHVLETNQPPSRVVYVGALGLRGGGNGSSSGGGHESFDRGDRGSRRERNDSSTNRSTSVDLFTVSIGSSPQISVGHSGNYSDSLAASRVVNEGMRRSNEIRGLSGSSVFNSPRINESSPLHSDRGRDNLGFSSSVLGSSASSVFNSPRISETPSLTTQGSGALSSLRIVRDSERRVESMIRSTSQRMDLIQLTHNPDPVERRMASMRLSSGLRSGIDAMGDRAADFARSRVYADVFSDSNATPSRTSAPAPSASEASAVVQAQQIAREPVVSPAEPSIKKKASGAVVSSGFVLDSKGQIRPHDVRVPFAPPANYYEARNVVTPATQDVRNTDISKQDVKQSLQQSIGEYKKACGEDEAFQQLQSARTTLEAQLKHDSANDVLVEQFTQQEAAFQQHPLYQQGCELAKQAQKLREDALAKARPMLGKREMQMGMSAKTLEQCDPHKKEAEAIRDDLLQPVREILKRPSTPPRLRRAGQFAKGVGKSAVDTAKGVVNLPIVAGKLLGGAVQSLATWEDKLGIGEKITDASELIHALCQEIKYEWENPEEFQARQKATQACRIELERAEKALNAEAYHNKDARELGYWSTEVLQMAFGTEIVKGAELAAKSGKVAGSVAEVSKVEGGMGSAVKGVKASKKVVSVAESAELAAKSGKVAESVAEVSKVEGGVEKAGKGTTVLQSGGHILNNRTLKALGLNREQAKFAIEKLKEDYNLTPNFHSQIMSNGDYVHPHTKKVFGNLFHYQGTAGLATLEQAQINKHLNEILEVTNLVFQGMSTKLQESIATLRSTGEQLPQRCTTAEAALFKVLENDDEQAIETLLDDPKLDVHAKNEEGNVALRKTLIEKGPVVNVKDREGKTPLQYVRAANSVYNPPPEVVNDPRVNRAKKEEIEEILEGLSRRVHALNTQYQEDIQAFSGNLTALEQAQSMDIFLRVCNRKDELGQAIASLKSIQVQRQQQCITAHAALFKALENDDEQAIETLLDDSKLDVNAKDEEGTPLLCIAAAKGNIEAMRNLIGNGADVNEKGSKDGLTPLQAAIKNGEVFRRKVVIRTPLPRPSKV